MADMEQANIIFSSGNSRSKFKQRDSKLIEIAHLKLKYEEKLESKNQRILKLESKNRQYIDIIGHRE